MIPVLKPRSFAALGGIIVLLAVAIGLTAYFVQRQARDQNWVTHTLEVQVRLSKIGSLLQDAETAQRGFLITENRRFETEFYAAAANVAPEIDRLASQVLDNPSQVAALDELRKASVNRLAFLTQAVTLQSNGQTADAIALIKTGKGKALMEAGISLIKTMFDEEQQLLGLRQAQALETGRQVQGAIILMLFSALVLGGFAVLDFANNFQAMQAANVALETAAERQRLDDERRAALESQLRQSQKMEAIGQLTGGVAHDFNNMLAIIIGSIDMLQRKLLRGDANVSRLADNAMEGAQRAASLTQRLLAFSRQQPLVPVVIDVNGLIGGITELLRRSIGESVELECVQSGGLWRTLVDPGQLEQAIINLAVNARDAMNGNGHLTIETFNASLDDRYSAEHADIEAGQFVAVAISDGGQGMTPDVMAKAFDPFFTTKGVGQGTGLGLSQVYGFVKQSRGHIKIYSEPGEGTTIKIYLPRYLGTDVPVSASVSADPGGIPAGHPSEIIFVVEDEDRVRQLTVDSLRDLGYTVVHASGGPAAIRTIPTIGRLSLLLTDIVMPGMNGRELADRVKSDLPDLQVLFTTGYTRNAVIHDGKLDANVNFLAKPFTVAQLARKVRTVIDSGQQVAL